jgi:hypothetical protein
MRTASLLSIGTLALALALPLASCAGVGKDGQYGQASFNCPFVGGPNNNPYGSRDVSNRVCQQGRDRIGAIAKARSAAKVQSAENAE